MIISLGERGEIRGLLFQSARGRYPSPAPPPVRRPSGSHDCCTRRLSIPAQVLSVLLSMLVGTYLTSSVILMRVILPARRRPAITAVLGGMRYAPVFDEAGTVERSSWTEPMCGLNKATPPDGLSCGPGASDYPRDPCANACRGRRTPRPPPPSLPRMRHLPLDKTPCPRTGSPRCKQTIAVCLLAGKPVPRMHIQCGFSFPVLFPIAPVACHNLSPSCPGVAK